MSGALAWGCRLPGIRLGAPARWKRLRGRLGPGIPQTASLPEVERERTAVVGAARHHRENRGLFDQHPHAETLFMTGSAKGFRETAHPFLDVAREGPVHVPVDPRRPRYDTVFHSNDGILGNAREIRVELPRRVAPLSRDGRGVMASGRRAARRASADPSPRSCPPGFRDRPNVIRVKGSSGRPDGPSSSCSPRRGTLGLHMVGPEDVLRKTTGAATPHRRGPGRLPRSRSAAPYPTQRRDRVFCHTSRCRRFVATCTSHGRDTRPARSVLIAQGGAAAVTSRDSGQQGG